MAETARRRVLSRTRHVLDFDCHTPTKVWFVYDQEGEMVNRRNTHSIDSIDWEDMGKPMEITVTVEPGNVLEREEAEMADKIADAAEVFQGDDAQWYVRTVSDNGQTILTSEGYKDRDYAVSVATDTGLPVKE